jgi:hypothetical protein
MRKFALATLSSILLLMASAGAIAAAAPYREVINDSGADDDFCGTGQTVEFSVTGQINWWDDKGFGQLTTIWTNPDNGASIVDSFAGGGKFTFIDDGDGAYTIKTVRQGLPVSLRVANGSPLLKDVGLVAIYDHFDADDNFLGEDIEVLAGPHPSIENHDLWCELAVAALGL